jgi:hypothetical protein
MTLCPRLGLAQQAGPRGQALAKPSSRVLVSAALPEAIGIRKEHPDRQPLVLGQLFPPIIAQGFAQQRGHVPELLGEFLSGTRRIRPLPPCQEGQARRSLY